MRGGDEATRLHVPDFFIDEIRLSTVHLDVGHGVVTAVARSPFVRVVRFAVERDAHAVGQVCEFKRPVLVHVGALNGAHLGVVPRS